MSAEDRFIADGEHLNCPHCGGSGHIDDTPNTAARELLLDELRRDGWMVAVHNDYRLDGEACTFWLFTKDGRAVKGEGATDAIALQQVREQINTLTQQQGGEQEVLPEPFCYLDQDGYRIGSERNSTYFQSLLESSRSGKPRWRDGLTLLYTADALRAYGDARATAALHTKQPAASEGDGIVALKEVVSDLLSWFPDKPVHEWRLPAGAQGADDAIAAAKAAIGAQENEE